jgi:hypothetical protein
MIHLAVEKKQQFMNYDFLACSSGYILNAQPNHEQSS